MPVIERGPILQELYRVGTGVLVVDDNVAALEAFDQRGRGLNLAIDAGVGRKCGVNPRGREAFVIAVALTDSGASGFMPMISSGSPDLNRSTIGVTEGRSLTQLRRSCGIV